MGGSAAGALDGSGVGTKRIDAIICKTGLKCCSIILRDARIEESPLATWRLT